MKEKCVEAGSWGRGDVCSSYFGTSENFHEKKPKVFRLIICYNEISHEN